MFLPPTMFGMSGHDFSGKGPGQVLLEKHRKLPLRYIHFCDIVLIGANFRVMLVRNISVSEKF